MAHFKICDNMRECSQRDENEWHTYCVCTVTCRIQNSVIQRARIRFAGPARDLSNCRTNQDPGRFCEGIKHIKSIGNQDGYLGQHGLGRSVVAMVGMRERRIKILRTLLIQGMSGKIGGLYTCCQLP